MSQLHNPYRPFFFVGTLAALAGVGVWMPYAFIDALPYPGSWHAHVMMGLFLLSFAMGFLMTALPKMTHTPITQRYEFQIASVTLGFVASVGLSYPSDSLFYYGILSNLLFMIYFSGRRLRIKRNNLPEIFPLVVWGMFSATVGVSLILWGDLNLGKNLFYLNFMLCMTLGVGSRLVPTIIKLPSKSFEGKSYLFMLVGAGLFVSSIVEQYLFLEWGAYLRATISSFVIIFVWRVFHRGMQKNAMTWGLRIAAVCIVSGLWALAITPQYRLEALHLLYVSGFSLMTFMVASRVILAHGKHGIEMENKNIFLKLAIFLIVLASFTRIAAIFVPNGYEKHLSYAAISFVLGVGIWARFFLPKVYGADPED